MPTLSPATALGAYYFAYFAYIGAYSPYITLWLKDVGMSAAQIGLIYAIPQVMRIFGPNLWGALSDSTGRPVAILRGATLCALLAFAGTYFGTGFAWLFLVFVLMHLFTSSQMPLVEAIALDLSGGEAGRYGRIRLWGSIGFIVSVVGLGALLDWLPTSTVLHVVTFMLGGVVLAAWLMPRPAQHRLEETGESVMAVLRVKEVQCFLLAGFMNAFAHAALYTFFSLYLAELGYDKTTIGLLWALGVVVEIGIFRWMPQLTARFSVRSLFFATFVACALRFLIIAWGAQSFMLLLFAQLLHALTFAVYHASAVTLTGQYFGERNRARGQGVYISLTFGFGGFVGALVSGLMWEPFGASLTYTVSALAGALGALAYLRYRT